MSTKEKWELALGCLGLVLMAWFYMSESNAMGTSIKHRLRWWTEQRRKHETEAAEFAKASAQLQFEAWTILQENA